jgi:hypothetical protein
MALQICSPDHSVVGCIAKPFNSFLFPLFGDANTTTITSELEFLGEFSEQFAWSSTIELRFFGPAALRDSFETTASTVQELAYVQFLNITKPKASKLIKRKHQSM